MLRDAALVPRAPREHPAVLLWQLIQLAAGPEGLRLTQCVPYTLVEDVLVGLGR